MDFGVLSPPDREHRRSTRRSLHYDMTGSFGYNAVGVLARFGRMGGRSPGASLTPLGAPVSVGGRIRILPHRLHLPAPSSPPPPPPHFPDYKQKPPQGKKTETSMFSSSFLFFFSFFFFFFFFFILLLFITFFFLVFTPRLCFF